MTRHSFHYWDWIKSYGSDTPKTPESFMAMHRRKMIRAKRWVFIRSLVVGFIILFVVFYEVTS